MKRIILILQAALLSIILLLPSAFAGVSKSSTSGPKGVAVRSSPRPTTSEPVTYKGFSSIDSSKGTASQARRPFASSTGKGAMSIGRRSILDSSSNRPSPQLQNIIREKEGRSGPGWLGTGFLIYLLSQHDLSSSDRQWIQTQIDNVKHSPDQPEPPPLELSDVVFRWDAPAVFRKGQKSLITVSAEQGTEGVHSPVTCTINGIASPASQDKAVLEWTPDAQTTVVVNCESDGLHDMRIFETEESKTLTSDALQSAG